MVSNFHLLDFFDGFPFRHDAEKQTKQHISLVQEQEIVIKPLLHDFRELFSLFTASAALFAVQLMRVSSAKHSEFPYSDISGSLSSMLIKIVKSIDPDTVPWGAPFTTIST